MEPSLFARALFPPPSLQDKGENKVAAEVLYLP